LLRIEEDETVSAPVQLQPAAGNKKYTILGNPSSKFCGIITEQIKNDPDSNPEVTIQV
jgi:hypothetical protein